jgi:hypothetical protein
MVGVLATNVPYTARCADIYLHSLQVSTKLNADSIKIGLSKRGTGQCFVTLPNALSAVDAVFVDVRLAYSGKSIQLETKPKHQLKAKLKELARPGTDVGSEAVCGRYVDTMNCCVCLNELPF